MKIAVRGGRVVDPANQLETVTDLFIDSGKIKGLGQAPKAFQAELDLDARGKLVLPGLVDLCAHLREPGQEHKATIASETLAAAAGGVTSLCCPPDTHPVADLPSILELIQRRARQAARTRVLVCGALTRKLAHRELSDMDALRREGCVAVGNARTPLPDSGLLRRAMEYATTCGLPLHLYAEEGSLSGDGMVNEGPVSTRWGLPSFPEVAETVAVARVLLLAAQSGARVHLCRLSTAASLHMVAEARARNLPISADVGVNYLHLCDTDLGLFDSSRHLRPPLRPESDREALREALRQGLLSVCSDHQPHEPEAKQAPFQATEAGSSSLELFLPLMLRLVREGHLELSQAVSAVTHHPAAVMGLPRGTLGVGAAADLCLVDPEAEWTVSPEELLSAGKMTSCDGWRLHGRVTHTLLDGRLVFERARQET